VSTYVLEIVEGPEAGRQVPLPGHPVEIGREESSAVKLTADSLVSRRHARLTPAEGGVLVEDLDSSNGTFVNGQQTYAAVLLTPGDELTIGVSVLELRTAAQAAGETTIRPVPAGLTAVRPAVVAPPPPEPPESPGLAAQERRPDYVPAQLARSGAPDSPLSPLLDMHTKRMARTAPLAIFVLVAFIVIVALALR
jgi:hypothetical protein